MGNRVFAVLSIALGLALALAPGSLLAQPPGTVAGRVTDSRSGEPIQSAAVRIEGTTLIVTTDRDGRYRITRVPAGSQTVTARGIGYKQGGQTVTVTAGAEATADFTLVYAPANLSEIVVTGTAGDQSRAAQGAVIASVGVDSLMQKAPVQTLNEALEGRVSSVNVTEGSGTAGTAPRITIRGPASISLSDEPIVFIDGVRMESEQRTDIGQHSQSLESLGGQALSALDDINPDDIESYEVVKGPAAATLYGADASAGVIQIITKKGKLGTHAFRQTFTGEWDQVQPNFTPYAVYGICSAPIIAAGPSVAPGCTGKTAGSVISSNPLVANKVFRDGNLGDLAWSGQGGADNFGYFLSATASNEQGTTPNNYVRRRTARANMHWVITPALSVDATATVGLNDNRVPMGDDSEYGYLIDAGALTNPFTGTTQIPITSLEQIDNDSRSWRETPTLQVQYVPFHWFTNRLTLGADLTQTDATTFFPTGVPGYFGDQVNGFIEDAQHPINVYTVDYLGNVHLTFGKNNWIASNTSFGSQYIDRVENYLAGVGIGLPANQSPVVSSGASTASYQQFDESKSLGFLAQEELGFDQILFIQGGFRVDQNSSFGTAYGAFFLPKVSGSFVLSQTPFWQSFAPGVSTLRFRAAYGTTGRSPLPGASLQTYSPISYVTPTGGTAPGVVQFSPGNSNLKPERGTEFEGGIDAGFLHDRVGLELTYFDKKTNDLLLFNPIAPSLAFTQDPYVNAGSVDNSGFEFTVRATPVSARDFQWDAQFTGNTIKNRLLSLGGLAISEEELLSADLTQQYDIGLPLASLFSSRILNTTSGYATVSNTPVFAGPQFPTYQGSINSTLTLFKTVRLYGLLTMQRGGKILDVTQYLQDAFGLSRQVNEPASLGGYTHADSLRRFGPFQTASGKSVGGVYAAYVEPSNFTRLKELSATLLLPPSVAQMLHGATASLTLGARDIWLSKSDEFQGYDPEVIAGAGNPNSPLSTWDEFTVPQPRRLFARLNLTF